ncbi:MAG: hypothetical protein WCA22_18620 [Candidatus Binatus sp.]
MADTTGIGKVLRDIAQAYVDGLSTIGGAIGDLAKRRIPDGERQMEHWIGVARAAKDGYVAAIDQSFAVWERRIRRTMAPPQSSSSGKKSNSEQKAPASQIEAWFEAWRDANESFMQSIRDSGLGEEALKQTRELRKTLDDGLKNLQKLWQPSSKG